MYSAFQSNNDDSHFYDFISDSNFIQKYDRSSRPLLARLNMAVATATPTHANNTQPNIPSIRLIYTAPSATGLSSETTRPSTAHLTSHGFPPKPKSAANEQPQKKLVPKKSKLGILSIGDKGRAKDFSDVVRHVGAPASASGRRSFEIYVGLTVNSDVGEIMIIKKKKSCMA